MKAQSGLSRPCGRAAQCFASFSTAARPRVAPQRSELLVTRCAGPQLAGETYLGEPYVRSSGAAPAGGAGGGAPPMQVQSLNHAAVGVQNVEAAVAWYQKVLGFAPLPRPGFPFGGAWLQAGDLTLHIIAADPTAPELVSNWKGLWRSQEALMKQPHAQPEPLWIRRSRHLAFQVADVAAAEAALKAHGIAYDRFEVPGTKAAQLFFYDPDGNGLEVGDYGPVSAALSGRQQ